MKDHLELLLLLYLFEFGIIIIEFINNVKMDEGIVSTKLVCF